MVIRFAKENELIRVNELRNQHKLEWFLVTRAGIEPTLTA